MAELINEKSAAQKDQKKMPVIESDEDSDADSLDSEGYDKQDPYAAQAKKFDRRNKIVLEYHQRPMVKAQKMVIE